MGCSPDNKAGACMFEGVGMAGAGANVNVASVLHC